MENFGSEKKIMSSFLKRSLLKIYFLSLFIPYSLQLHSPTSTFRPGISGFVHSVDKRPVEEIPHTLRFFATSCLNCQFLVSLKV